MIPLGPPAQPFDLLGTHADLSIATTKQASSYKAKWFPTISPQLSKRTEVLPCGLEWRAWWRAGNRSYDFSVAWPESTVQCRPPARRICGASRGQKARSSADLLRGEFAGHQMGHEAPRPSSPRGKGTANGGTTAHDTNERTGDTLDTVTDVHEPRGYGDGCFFEIGKDTHLARETPSGGPLRRKGSTPARMRKRLATTHTRLRAVHTSSPEPSQDKIPEM